MKLREALKNGDAGELVEKLRQGLLLPGRRPPTLLERLFDVPDDDDDEEEAEEAAEEEVE
jgi:hypothetical protein